MIADKPDFEAFWKKYPRRTAKGQARKSWDRAVNKATPATILFALQSQRDAGMFSDDLQFVPHPGTWLNQERWDDDVIARQRPQFRNGAAELLAREMSIGPVIEDMPAHMLEGPAGD